MRTMNILDITGGIPAYRGRIRGFLEKLTSERRYFASLTFDMVVNSDLLIVAEEEGGIAGMAGVNRKYGIVRNYIVLKKEVQGKGVGEKLLLRLIAECRKRHHLIMCVVGENNAPSRVLHLRAGAVEAGRRNRHDYLFIPLSRRGVLFAAAFRVAFRGYAVFKKWAMKKGN